MDMPFLNLPGWNMYYEEYGTGSRNIVAIHGNLASTRWWRYLWPYVPQKYRVIAMDLRGCGQSSRVSEGYQISQFAEDIDGLAQALELEQFHLLGHSMGGQIALAYTIAYPHKVQTLTLLDSVPANGLDLSEEGRQVFAKLQQDKGFLRQAIRSCVPYVENQDFVTELWEDAFGCAPEIYFRNPETMHETVLLGEAEKLTTPTLLVHGREDSIIPVAAMQETIRAMSRARVVFLENCGHSPFIEKPQTAAQIYFQFLGDHDCKEGK